jgi:hypothetical protein
VAVWKRELETQLAEGIKTRKRGPKPDPSLPLKKENERQAKQIARLKDELRRARLMLEVQKKIAEMFPALESDETRNENGA